MVFRIQPNRFQKIAWNAADPANMAVTKSLSVTRLMLLTNPKPPKHVDKRSERFDSALRSANRDVNKMGCRQHKLVLTKRGVNSKIGG